VTDRTIRIWENVEGPMRDASNIAFKLARVLGVERSEIYVRPEPASRR